MRLYLVTFVNSMKEHYDVTLPLEADTGCHASGWKQIITLCLMKNTVPKLYLSFSLCKGMDRGKQLKMARVNYPLGSEGHRTRAWGSSCQSSALV